jgi:hypothetical protein
MMSRAELSEVMKMITATVVFEKVDGTLRTMKCTLKPEALPPIEVDESSEKKTRKVNPNILSVWDLEKNEWRSFRIDTVKNISFSP